MNKPSNDNEALVAALRLAISAESDDQFNRAVALAEDFAARLSEVEVARAKAEAGEQA
tara:strand:+ start:433 stop:606 length:174 start_codon:yes stop_codon:yes gene_type:complete